MIHHVYSCEPHFSISGKMCMNINFLTNGSDAEKAGYQYQQEPVVCVDG